jgi:hypothetical protein
LNVLVLLTPFLFPVHASDWFAIGVLDQDSGEPVGCVSLVTTNGIVHTSDDNGAIAFYEPGLVDETVWFTVSSEHYAADADFYGFEGSALSITSGGLSGVWVHSTGASAPCDGGDEATRLFDQDVPAAAERFRIEVIDAETGRGVPLVEVRSPNRTWVTDSAGLVAWHELDLLGKEVTFEVVSHGYTYKGVAGDGLLVVTPEAGGQVTLALDRDNIAERLYRVTGQGIYTDSVLLDEPTPLKEPVLSGLVMGQDSNLSTVYQGQAWWFWGDTSKPSYPLGNFQVTGAVSDLPGAGGLEPDVGVDLDYFVDDDRFSRELALFEPGLLTWLNSVVAVSDGAGGEVLYATYGLYAGLGSEEASGIARWSDADEVFEEVRRFTEADVVQSVGPAHVVDHDEGPYVYRARLWSDVNEWTVYELQHTRVLASPEALEDPAVHQVFTPFIDSSATAVERIDGKAIWAWRTGAAPADEDAVDAGLLTDRERLSGHLRDPDSGLPVVESSMSIHWNHHAGRYVQLLGEGWNAEAFLGMSWVLFGDTPMGPWVYGRKVVHHDDYSFYNLNHHAFLDRDNGRFIHFEGTYTYWLSTRDAGTPRYDYNQVMYRLDLDDPRLVLPVAVYDRGPSTSPGEFLTRRSVRSGDPDMASVFFALEAAESEWQVVPLSWTGPSCAQRALVAGETDGEVAFYALDADSVALPPDAVPLYAYGSDDGAAAYSTDPTLALEGLTLEPQPLAHVWVSPIDVAFPLADHLPPVMADGGIDLCLTEDWLGEGATVSLDGSGSRSTIDEIVSFVWTTPNGELTGAAPTIVLPIGVHRIDLLVTSTEGITAQDRLVVQVSEGEARPDSGDSDSGGSDSGGSGGSPDDTGAKGDSGEDSTGRDCGCAAASPTQAGWLWALAVLLGARRRRVPAG